LSKEVLNGLSPDGAPIEQWLLPSGEIPRPLSKVGTPVLGSKERKGMMTEWTTRIDPKHTRNYGVEEVHEAVFEPFGWPGKGTCIAFLWPEREVQHVEPRGNNDFSALVFRLPSDRSLKECVRGTCSQATAEKAFVIFGCDTAADVVRVVKWATKWLPQHRRMAIERMYEVKSRARDNLS
jgi:hypothetical protein